MPTGFKPPTRKSLATVDRCEGIRYPIECVVVEGVVDARSQGGWAGLTGGYDIHSFSFAAWRKAGEPLVERELLLMRPVPLFEQTRKEGKDPFGDLPPLSIQRLSVLLSTNCDRAVVESVLPAGKPDPELVAVAQKLSEPVVIKSKRFGDLVQDSRIGWYEAEVQWNRKTVRLQLLPGAGGSITGALKTAEALWQDEAAWKRKIDAYAIAELLPIKNDCWLGDGEGEVTKSRFKSRMKLTSITVSAGGRFEFWHHDGDLFLGHYIHISGNLKKGPTQADIPG